MTTVNHSLCQFSPSAIDHVFAFKSEQTFSDDDEAEMNISQWLKLDSVDLEQSSWSCDDAVSELSPEPSFDTGENNNCSPEASSEYSDDSSCLQFRAASNSSFFVPIQPDPTNNNSAQLPPHRSHAPSCGSYSSYLPSSYSTVSYCPYPCCSAANAQCCSEQFSFAPFSVSQSVPPFTVPHAVPTPTSSVSYTQAVSPTRSRSPSPLLMYSSYTHTNSMLPSTINLLPKQCEEERPKARALSTSTGCHLISNSSMSLIPSLNETGPVRRVRQTRPKVIEAKGAKQCKGRNRKKGIQCRNAALMEYIGPRPEYCAEHIDLDPKSLYTKCKSPYQKEVGDNKGCKEVVLKEFGVCYKHYADAANDMIRNKELDTLRHQQSRIVDLLHQLEREAAAAKKKDGDLYQRKNKLIPKFQEMKKLAVRAIDALQSSNLTGDPPVAMPVPAFLASPPLPSSCPYGVALSFGTSYKEEADATPEDVSSEEFSPVLMNTHTFLLDSTTDHRNHTQEDRYSSLSCDFLA